MAHLSGQLLCQTVYTCTFLHAPKLHPKLQTPILLLLKSISLIRNCLTQASTIQEEEYSFDTSGFTLFDDVEHHELLAEVEFQLKLLNIDKENEEQESLLERLEFFLV